MKKLIKKGPLLFVGGSLFLTSVCQALISGPYLGLQLGYGTINYGLSDIPSSQGSIQDGGFAGRVYGGYQISKYWATELGYEQFSSVSFNNVTSQDVSGTSKVSAFDWVGKFIYPLGESDFSLSAKAGGAYTVNKISGSVSQASSLSSTNVLQFTYGVGLNYSITPWVVTDLTWTIIQNTSSMPSSNLYTLGLSYFFG